MMRFKCCSFLILLLPASAAAAATEPTPTVEGGVNASEGAPPSEADVNIDRGLLLPTAMTQPAGSLTYNNY
jgi:hypothetical protein